MCRHDLNASAVKRNKYIDSLEPFIEQICFLLLCKHSGLQQRQRCSYKSWPKDRPEIEVRPTF
jgi:hypothetical protein